MSDVIRVQEPSLADFAYKIAELAKQGYEVSGTNQGYPQSFGFGVYTCEMLKGQAKGTSESTSKPAQKQEPVEAPEKPSEDVSEAPAANAQETQENAVQEPTGNQKSTTGSRRGRRKTAAKK